MLYESKIRELATRLGQVADYSSVIDQVLNDPDLSDKTPINSILKKKIQAISDDLENLLKSL